MRQLVREGVIAPETPTDRRAMRSRVAIRDSLTELIRETGDLTQVTVTAVSERAGITRRTFYGHYRDIPDLVARLEDEAVTELAPLMGDVAKTTLDDLQESLGNCEPCPGSVELLSYFAERPHLAALLSEGGDPSFAEKIKRLAHDIMLERVCEGLSQEILDTFVGTFVEYYLSYAISAEVGILVRWLEGGPSDSVESIARLMTALTFVRPGDLYGKHIDFDVVSFGSTLLALNKECN